MDPDIPSCAFFPWTDANDAAQFAELKVQGELTKRAWERGVQVGARVCGVGWGVRACMRTCILNQPLSFLQALTHILAYLHAQINAPMLHNYASKQVGKLASVHVHGCLHECRWWTKAPATCPWIRFLRTWPNSWTGECNPPLNASLFVEEGTLSAEQRILTSSLMNLSAGWTTRPCPFPLFPSL